MSKMTRFWTFGAAKACLINLLYISRLIETVEGVNCYYCAWIDSTDGYYFSSLTGRNDVCRPQNFDSKIVHTAKCRNGCVTTVLHETMANCSGLEATTLNSFVLTKVGGEPGPETRADQDVFPPLPVTFFYRGCPNNHTTKLANGCEFVKFENGCRQRTCYCTTELCNGEQQQIRSDASNKLSNKFRWKQNALMLVVRMISIMAMR